MAQKVTDLCLANRDAAAWELNKATGSAGDQRSYALGAGLQGRARGKVSRGRDGWSRTEGEGSAPARRERP